MGDYGGTPAIGSTSGLLGINTSGGNAINVTVNETDINGTLHAPSMNVSGNDTASNQFVTGRTNCKVQYLNSSKTPDTLKFNNYNSSVFCYESTVSTGSIYVIGYGNDGNYLEITNNGTYAVHILVQQGVSYHGYTIYPLSANSTTYPMTVSFRSVQGYWSAIGAQIQ